MSPDEIFRLVAVSTIVVLLSGALSHWLAKGFLPLVFGALHFLVQVVINSNWGIVGRDAEFYHRTALQIADALGENDAAIVSLTDGKEGWPYLLGALYHLTSPTPTIGLLLNSCLFTIGLALVGAIASTIDELNPSYSPTHRLASVAIFFLPPMWIWSVSLLKEPVFWVCVLSIVLAVLRIASRGYSVAMILLLASGAIGGSFVRASVTYVVLAICLVFLVLGRAQRAGQVADKRKGFHAVVSLTALMAASMPAISYFAGSKYLDDEALGATRESLSSAGSGFSNSGLSDFPVVMLRVALGPFPWELVRMSPIYAIDWVVWMIILFGSVLALPRWRPVVLVPVSAFFVLLALAAVTANYGTMIRIRTVAGLILFPLAAMGYVRVRKRGNRNRVSKWSSGSQTTVRHL